MQKVISYSLWGLNPKYYIGAIRNVEMAKTVYPEYKLKFYVDVLVPRGILIQLEDMGAEITEMGVIGDFRGMFWRFDAVNKYDIVLIRDTDSRLSLREKAAVDEWAESNSGVHTIFDHPYHSQQFLIMPGLSGFKRGAYSSLDTRIKIFSQVDRYGIDYEFFNGIFSEIKNNIFIHDSIYGRGKDLKKRQGLEFCGKIYDENEQTVLEHEEVLKRWLKSNENKRKE
jgi:hypothetical protein